MIIVKLLFIGLVSALAGIITFGLTDSLLATLLAGVVVGLVLSPILED